MNTESLPDDSESHRNRVPEVVNYDAKPSTSISQQRTRLPPELIDIIIGMLRSEQAALAICALVCRSWLPASRHHLYSHITISPKNYEIYRLSATAPWIGSVVKHLTLEGMRDLEKLHEVIHRFSNVTQLSIEDLIVTRMVISQPAWVSLVQNLESLEFTGVQFDIPETFLSLLYGSPRLWDLRCHYIDFDTITDYSVWHPVPGILIPKLKRLHVCGIDDPLCCIIVHLAITAPRFTTLVLDPDYARWQDISWERLLMAVGSRLQDLQLSPFSDNIPHVAACFVFLTQLRSVCFSAKYHFPDPLNFVVDALRRLKSPHLEELTVVLLSLNSDALDEDKWSDLDSLLDSPRFATLRAIVFRVPHDAFRSQEGLTTTAARDQWIAERLPLCAARGIVRSMSPSRR